MGLFVEARPWLSMIDQDRDFIHDLYDQQYRVMRQGQEAIYPEHLDLLIERLGDPVGRLIIDLGYEGWRISELQISARARRSGIGTGVIRVVQAGAARSRRCIRLSTPAFHEPARALYERLGFRLEGHDGLYCHLIWNDRDHGAGGFAAQYHAARAT